MVDPWTEDQVQEHLIRWAWAWKRADDKELRYLRTKGPSWAFKIARDHNDIYAEAVANGGRHEDMAEPRLGNTRADLALRDRVDEWFRCLPSIRQQKIVAYASFSLTRRNKNIDWRFVKRMAETNLHTVTLGRIYNDGLSKIAGSLTVQDYENA